MTAPTTADNGLDRGVLAVAAVVVLGAIMSILDTTVVNVAISHLSTTFDTSLETGAVNSSHHVRACRLPTRQTATAATMTSATAARRTAGTGSGGGIPDNA